MPRFKDILALLILPIIVVGAYLMVYIIWRMFNLPTNEAAANLVMEKFSQYGLWLVFVGALIEGFFVLGQYFPGGAIIFLGVISAGKDIPRAAAVVGVVFLAFAISYTLNYFLGKYGWYKLFLKFGLGSSLATAQKKMIKQDTAAMFFSYWDPNLASLTATAAGILQIPLKRFETISLLSIAFWSTFWGIFVYQLGQNAFKIMGLKYVLIIFVIWCTIILLKHYLYSKNRPIVSINEQ